MRPGQLFNELRRRHVLRVIGAYAFAAWITVEVYTTVQPILFETAEWSNRVVVVLALACFPIAFALAWIFDITPAGIRRTSDIDAEAGVLQPVHVPARRDTGGRASGFFGLGTLVALVAFAAYAGIEAAGAGDDAASSDEVVIRSIAVLPFTSADGSEVLLSDGIAEELLNRLTQVPDLRVPARTSSFAFRDGSVAVGDIGRQLGVQAVVQGTVRREGERVRVTAELVSVATGYRLWSQRFDVDATDVFALQDQLADAIMQHLSVHVAAAPEAGERGTTDPRAYELYLLGMQRWHNRTDRDLRQALVHFDDAIEQDPQFALAHAALAQTYAVLPSHGSFAVDTAIRRGSAAAAQAIALDPSLADAYAAMGQIVQNFEWDLHGAERYYQRALEYSNSVTAHQWYAETLLLLGRHADAQQHIAIVLQRDALSPVALYVAAFLETVRGRTANAMLSWRHLARLHPDFELGLATHVYSAVATRDTAGVGSSLARLAALTPERAGLYRGVAAALSGSGTRTAALATLRALDGGSASERAAWQMVLGDQDGAIGALEQAYEQVDANLPYMLAHPLFRPLRRNARFRLMTDRIGIGSGG
ncbi:hypothetical protein BH23GEM10_BH23GEM10_06020 [soil metagenome]